MVASKSAEKVDSPPVDEASVPNRAARRWLRLSLWAALAIVAVLGTRYGIRRWVYSEAAYRIDQFDPRTAIERLDQAEKWLGRSAQSELLKAAAWRVAGQKDRFEFHLQEARRQRAAVSELTRQEILFEAQVGRTERAESTRAAMLAEQPGREDEVYQALLTGYIASFRLGDAKRLIDLWRTEDENDPRINFWSGRLRAADYALDQAAPEFKKAVELMPDHWRARLEYAEVLKEVGDREDAIREFRVLLNSPAPDARVRIGLASCLVDQGQAKEAIEIFKPIEDPVPDDSETRYLFAQAYFEAGQVEDAVRWLTPLLERWPENISYLQLMNRALVSSQRPAEATAIAQRIAASQKRDDILDDQIYQLERNQGDMSLRCTVGLGLMQLRSPEAGAGYFRSVLAVDPRYPPAHAGLAEYYRKEGNSRLALSHQKLGNVNPVGDVKP